MNEILFAVFGIMLTFIGFRMYSYFNKNLETIDYEPGKLFGIAVIVILMGIMITIISSIIYFRN